MTEDSKVDAVNDAKVNQLFGGPAKISKEDVEAEEEIEEGEEEEENEEDIDADDEELDDSEEDDSSEDAGTDLDSRLERIAQSSNDKITHLASVTTKAIEQLTAKIDSMESKSSFNLDEIGDDEAITGADLRKFAEQHKPKPPPSKQKDPTSDWVNSQTDLQKVLDFAQANNVVFPVGLEGMNVAGKYHYIKSLMATPRKKNKPKRKKPLPDVGGRRGVAKKTKQRPMSRLEKFFAQ